MNGRSTMPKPPRPPLEMLPVDLSTGWQPLAGFSGLTVKTLADDLDETAKTGARTRLVRFAPGIATGTALVHDYWEEVFILSGGIRLVGDTEDGVASAPSYCCRPPGTPHGPFVSPEGCIMLEVQYYAR